MNEGLKEESLIPAIEIDHIGHAVPNLEIAINSYQRIFGMVSSEIKVVEQQGIRIAYLSLGNVKIELMEPLNDKSPINKFLARNPKGGIHHYCIVTNDINSSYDKSVSNQLNILNKPTQGHHGRNLYFIHPSETNGALIEVEEPAKKW